MRSFIAIPLPEEFLEGTVAVQQGLAPVMNGRFTPRENLHLTLAFLGDIDEHETRAAMDAMDAAVEDAGEVRLAPASLGSFDRKKDSMFWLGLDKDPGLMALQVRLVEELATRGVPFEKRAYLPHVTLARRASMRSGELKGLAFPLPQVAEQVTLFRSELTPDGARYKEAYSVQLGT